MRSTATGGLRALPRRPRLGLLDVLRIIAAVSVLAFHYTARTSPAWGGVPPAALAPVGRWAIYGRMGVALFFVISGFVILMSAWGRTVPQFVASRVARLYPAYWVAVAVSAVVTLRLWTADADFFGHHLTSAQVALNLSMFQAAAGVPDVDAPAWTLWNEARFYVLVGLLVCVGITRRRVLAFAALWPLVALVLSSSGGSVGSVVSTTLMPDYAPFFAGGMLLYVIHRYGHDLFTWLLVGLQVLLATNWAIPSYTYMLRGESVHRPTNAVIGLLTFLCFGLVALVTVTPLRRVSARWMVLAGALTYPVYLLHEDLGWYLISRAHDAVGPWAAVGIAVLTVLVCSYLLHRAVDGTVHDRLRRAVQRALTRSEPPAAGEPRPQAVEAAEPAARAEPAGPRPSAPPASSPPISEPTGGEAAARQRRSPVGQDTDATVVLHDHVLGRRPAVSTETARMRRVPPHPTGPSAGHGPRGGSPDG